MVKKNSLTSTHQEILGKAGVLLSVYKQDEEKNCNEICNMQPY